MPGPTKPDDTLTRADTPRVAASRAWEATAFRGAARVEAVTWVGLLVGMGFKYLIADTDLGVRVFGPLHGLAFIAYVVAAALAARRYRWSWRLLLASLLVSIPPVFTWPFERYVAKRGHLNDV